MPMPTVSTPPEDLLDAEVVATWPDGTFLENLAFDADGTLHVTGFLQAQRFRVDVGTGAVEAFATDGFHPTGIAFGPGGDAVLAGHRQPGFDPRPDDAPDGFWRLTPGGEVHHLADALGARFLNGVTSLGDGRFACADSSGALWVVDLDGAVERVLHGAPLDPVDPAEPLPAANGIKVLDGRLYVSNWVRATIVVAPLEDLTAFSLVTDDVIVDDFAFAADGALFGASHLETVVRVDPDGTKTTVAGRSQGVHGCTACAFGPAGDERSLYVITDGGQIAGAPEPARLVRLRADRPGVSP